MTSPQQPAPTAPPTSPPPAWPTPMPATVPEQATPERMTQPEQTPPSPPAVVIAETDTRLEQLTAEWWSLKPQVEQMQKRLKELSDGIKSELTSTAPEGSTEIVLRSEYLPAPYRLHAVESWRVDATALKKADPYTYAKWAKKSVSWRFEQVK